MRIPEHEFAGLKRAYEILGIPSTSSTHAIKSSYRRLAKRWHPDLYPSGTQSHDEAANMMKVINEAYEKIQHAPLRYPIEVESRVPAEKSEHTASPNADPISGLPSLARIEFWVRFVFGAFWGVLMSFGWMLRLYHPSGILLAASCAFIIIGSGLAAARMGDDFWTKIVGRRHFW